MRATKAVGDPGWFGNVFVGRRLSLLLGGHGARSVAPSLLNRRLCTIRYSGLAAWLFLRDSASFGFKR